MNKKEIKKIKSKNKKIKIVRTYKKNNLKIYDRVQIWWFDDDKDYKIIGLSGLLFFENDLKGCKKKQNEIAESLKVYFSNIQISKKETINTHDITRKSKTYHYIFKFSNGDNVNVQCYRYSKEVKIKYPSTKDHLKVMMVKKKMRDHFSAAKN